MDRILFPFVPSDANLKALILLIGSLNQTYQKTQQGGVVARITRNPHCDTNTATAVNTARGECRCAAGHKELASAV